MQTAVVPASFADRLHTAIARVGSPACVGLDPVLEKLPSALSSPTISVGSERTPGSGKSAPAKRGLGAAARIEAFCDGVIDALARDGSIAIVKPQSACFERFGEAGAGILKRTIRRARDAGLIVILDAKRGDIGTTAEHYAAAAFGSDASHPAMNADALTLNGYMGPDTIEPFLPDARTGARAGTGVFVLVRTSNPGSDAIQAQRLADGRTVAEMMADTVATLGHAPGTGRVGVCGLSCVGAVVGATKSAEGEALRARMPEQFLLVPGFGAQGGTLDDLKPLLRSRSSAADAGIVVNASRSVLYPSSAPGSGGAGGGADWSTRVRDAARAFSDELRTLFS